MLGTAWLTLLFVGCDSNTEFPGRDGGASDAAVEGGTIQISGATNNCPAVAITISPPDGDVGGSVLVAASASDPDVGGDAGQTLTYAWKASAGAFDDVGVAQTWYHCASGGPQVLTVSVSDGKCTAAISGTVTCFGAPSATGSGGKPGSATGGSSGTGARSGSGGTSGSGNAPGSGSGGTGTGSGTGGTGNAGPGTGGSSGSMACSGDPTMNEGDGCNKCTMENCNLAPNPGATDGCSLAMLGSATAVQKCQNLYCCIRTHNCYNAVSSSYACYCGTADTSGDCRSKMGAANGPCLKEFEDAAGSNVPADIFKVLINPSYPLGGAYNLAECRAQFCSKYAGPDYKDNPKCEL